MSIDAIKAELGHEAAGHVLNEARAQLSDLGLDHRAIFSSRLVHGLKQETHVIVGDHDPEPRTDLEWPRQMKLDSYDADGHYGAERGVNFFPPRLLSEADAKPGDCFLDRESGAVWSKTSKGGWEHL